MIRGSVRCWGMSSLRRASRGQALIEYAVLVAAVILGVVAAANVAYRVFVGHAQTIERRVIVF